MVSKKIAIAVTIIVLIVVVYFGQNFRNEVSFHNVVSENKNSYVMEYSLPPNSAPNGLVVDKNGLVWVATKNSVLYSIDSSRGQMKSYEIKDGATQYANTGVNSTMVWSIIQDDGKIWFSPYGASSIWRLDQASDTFDTTLSETGTPFQMKAGNNDEIWFTTLRGNTIGVIEKTQNNAYKILAFDTGNSTNPAGIFLQNDFIWVAGVASQNISQYKINRQDGSVKDISIIQKIPKDNTTLFSSPTDLLVDKNTIWLTEHGTSFLTSYDINNGKTTRYPTSQNSFHTTTLPFWIRGTKDPQILWFNEHQGNKIGRFDISNRTLTEYYIPSLPKDGYLTYPLNISQDPQDEKILWFSEWNTDKIGVINGHTPIPFEISLDTTHVTLNRDEIATVGMEIQGNAQHSGHVFLNASSTITPTAELGNLVVQFSSNVADVSNNNKVKILFQDGGIAPGNYTVGISASDGIVTTTKFVDLFVTGK